MASPFGDIPLAALSPRLLDRMELCGIEHPVTRVDVETGETFNDRVPHRCRSLWCTECAAAYRARVESRLRARFGESEDVIMLTLTHRNQSRIRLLDGRYCDRGAKDAIDLLRAHWRAATALIRDAQRRLRRAKTRRGRLAAIARIKSPDALEYGWRSRDEFARTYRAKTGWRGLYDERTWSAVIEVATSNAWYHAHLHVVCASRAVAELLNAAWQQTSTDEQHCQTRIRRDITQTASSFAHYTSKYVVKPHSWDKDDNPDEAKRHAVARAIVSGFHRVRRINGAGAWHSLGLRRVRGKQPVEMWHPCDAGPTEVAERTAETAPSGLTRNWHRGGFVRSLERYRARVAGGYLEPQRWAHSRALVRPLAKGGGVDTGEQSERIGRTAPPATQSQMQLMLDSSYAHRAHFEPDNRGTLANGTLAPPSRAGTIPPDEPETGPPPPPPCHNPTHKPPHCSRAWDSPLRM